MCPCYHHPKTSRLGYSTEGSVGFSSDMGRHGEWRHEHGLPAVAQIRGSDATTWMRHDGGHAQGDTVLQSGGSSSTWWLCALDLAAAALYAVARQQCRYVFRAPASTMSTSGIMGLCRVLSSEVVVGDGVFHHRGWSFWSPLRHVAAEDYGGHRKVHVRVPLSISNG